MHAPMCVQVICEHTAVELGAGCCVGCYNNLATAIAAAAAVKIL